MQSRETFPGSSGRMSPPRCIGDLTPFPSTLVLRSLGLLVPRRSLFRLSQPICDHPHLGSSFPCSIAVTAPAISHHRFRPAAAFTSPRFPPNVRTNSKTLRWSSSRSGYPLVPRFPATKGLDWRSDPVRHGTPAGHYWSPPRTGTPLTSESHTAYDPIPECTLTDSLPPSHCLSLADVDRMLCEV